MQAKDNIDLDGELRCPRCVGKDLAPSLARGAVDWVMGRFGYIPRHCRFCGSRFYVAREALSEIDRAPAEARQTAYPQTAPDRPHR